MKEGERVEMLLFLRVEHTQCSKHCTHVQVGPHHQSQVCM